MRYHYDMRKYRVSLREQELRVQYEMLLHSYYTLLSLLAPTKCATCGMELLPYIDKLGKKQPRRKKFCDNECVAFYRKT